jgi:hypothetical protein
MQQGVFEIRRRSFRARLFAMLDENAPQLLNDTEQRLAALLDQNAAQQDSERTDIATEREILSRVGGACRELGQVAALVVNASARTSTGAPKRRVTHVQS